MLAFILFSLSLNTLSAQENCNTFFLFEEGVEWAYQTLNKKGKVESTSIQTVQDLKQSGNQLTATLAVTLKDKKGKELYSGPSEITCDGEKIFFDISDMLPQNVTEMGGSGEVTMEGDGFLLPNNLKAGDQLPDSRNTVNVDMGAMSMKTEFSMTNFEVHGIEEVRTPAGTYQAMKISYDNSAKMMMVKAEGSTITWYAKGVGTVRTESFDKKGKLVSIQELIRFKK
jgi:hypothetical protein